MLPLLAAAAVGFSPLPPSQTTVRISSEEELTGAVLGPLPELGESLPASLQAVCAGVVPCAGQADDPTAWRPPRGGAAQPCKGQGDDPTIALVSLVFSILFNPSLFQVVPRGGTESVASRGNSPAPTFLCSNSTAKNSEWVAENAGPTAEPPIKAPPLRPSALFLPARPPAPPLPRRPCALVSPRLCTLCQPAVH